MIDFDELEPDRRGNVLRGWSLRGGQEHLRVHLCCAFAVAKHVRSILASAGGSPRTVPFAAGEGWTHCYEVGREIPELAEILEMLESCLVLQDLPGEIDSAIALDFYKIPRPGSDPYTWPNTPVGELVSRLKYAQDPMVTLPAADELADRLAEVIRRHPIYRSAALVSVPGHDASITAPSERLAIAVADKLGKPLTRARANKLLRPETKGLTGRVDLRGEFVVAAENVGYAVLVLDDVYEHGRNMRGVAAAARASGAREVHGLVAARTTT